MKWEPLVGQQVDTSGLPTGSLLKSSIEPRFDMVDTCTVRSADNNIKRHRICCRFHAKICARNDVDSLRFEFYWVSRGAYRVYWISLALIILRVLRPYLEFDCIWLYLTGFFWRLLSWMNENWTTTKFYCVSQGLNQVKWISLGFL